LEKKFVVFESEMDLKAHQLEEHPNGLTKDARRVDLSDFSYRERYQPQRGGRESHRGGGRGRGRDPNADALPQSSAQSMRRDELAFQRQLALQTPQTIPQRSFAGNITASEPTQTANSRVPAVPTPDPFPSLSGVGQALPNPSVPTSLTREQEMRQIRHQAIIDRASQLLRNDQTKLSAFRSNISSYTHSSITATELIESFFSLFDTSSAELGKLVKELVDIFEISTKRDGLLRAWNDWKAINEDYPSLPGSGATVGASSHGGSRVLKLKSSTAQSSRSAVSRTASWGTASSSDVSSTPAATSKSGKRRPITTPWAGSSTGTTTLSTPSKAKQAGPSGVSDASAFPALPAAAKPLTSSFSRGYNGPGVIRNGGSSSSSVNAWSNRPAADVQDALEDNVTTGGANEKKKGGRKKQTLMHWG
jgi:hypothetical protein